MALNKEQKKAIRRIAIAAIIYMFIFGVGMGSDDGAMSVAMKKVREEVASARAAIKKEMEKPFILRIFGSIFGQEDNTFAKMKERLPKIMEDAMPDFLAQQTESAPASKTACKGMRLFDALEYLHAGKVEILSLSWDDIDKVEEDIFVTGPGVSLKVEEVSPTQVHLLIQMQHDYISEDGLGKDYTEQQESLAALREAEQAYKLESLFLNTWLDNISNKDRKKALTHSLPLVDWSSLAVPWCKQADWPQSANPADNAEAVQDP